MVPSPHVFSGCSGLLLFLAVVCCGQNAVAFTVPQVSKSTFGCSSHRTLETRNRSGGSSNRLEIQQFRRHMLDPIPIVSADTEASSSSSSEKEETKLGPAKQFDTNGKEFTVGCIVRVATDKLKAYQVPAKGHGKFDTETKEFIPSPEGGGDRGSKSLLVPPGLRGVVTRVYDTDDLDASQPILVKFVKGDHTEEGYSSPVTFLMHFLNEEVEVVV